MSTWVYRCDDCSFTFGLQIPDEVAIPESVTCPQCDAEAVKQFEMPAGGCGCGCEGGCC